MLTMTDLVCGAGGSTTGAVTVPGVSVRVAPFRSWLMVMDSLGYQHTIVSLNSMHAQIPDDLWGQRHVDATAPLSVRPPVPLLTSTRDGRASGPRHERLANDTPSAHRVRASGVVGCQGWCMPTEHRSRARAANLTFRMTAEERARLQADAAAEGFDSLQQLLEARVWGAAKPRRRPGRQPQEERLDISA